MPNHVTNIIRAPRHVLYALLSEKRGVDFDRVIPEPAETDPIFTATLHDYGDGVQGWSTDGYSPMDWHREHWGTKWNAYGQVTDHVDDGEVCFETAWSHPRPVIKALSEKFPEDAIDVRYADEDTGYNCGRYLIKGGKIISDSSPEPGSAPARAFARRVYRIGAAA